MKTLVIIPVINGEKTILETINNIKTTSRKVDILVVDFGSDDRTICLLETNKIPFLSFPLKTNYNQAFKMGMLYAQDQKYDFVVEYDFRNIYDFKELKTFFKHAKEYDLILGKTQSRKKKDPFVSFAIKLVTKNKITDLSTNFRLYNKKAIDILAENNYFLNHSSDNITFLLENKLSFKEVDIEIKNNLKQTKKDKKLSKNIKYFRSFFSIIFLKLWRKIKIFKFKKELKNASY